MLRTCLLLMVLATVSQGCDFDRDYLVGNLLPRSVELINASPEEIDLEHLYGTPDATETFSLPGRHMAPGSSLTWRVQMGSYEDILSGRFLLRGTCGDLDPWERTGTSLRQHITRQDDLGQLTIAIPACDDR